MEDGMGGMGARASSQIGESRKTGWANRRRAFVNVGMAEPMAGCSEHVWESQMCRQPHNGGWHQAG